MLKVMVMLVVFALLLTTTGCPISCQQCGLDPYATYYGVTKAGAQVSFETNGNGCGSYTIDGGTCGLQTQTRIS